MTTTAPLKTPRLAAYAFAIALGAVSIAAAAHSRIAKLDEVDRVSGATGAMGITADIKTPEPNKGGLVLLIGGVLVILFSFFAIGKVFVRKSTQSARGLRIESAVYSVLALLFFGIAIYLTVTLRKNNIQVEAFGPTGIRLPQSIVDAQAAALGLSQRYWDRGYLKFMAIAPWFTFLACAVAAAVTFLASNRAATTTTKPVVSESETKIGAGQTTEQKEHV